MVKVVSILRALLALVVLAGASAPVAQAGSEPAETNRPIKIGFIASLSGVGTPLGREASHGIRLALDEMNNQIAGRKVELIIANDQSSPAEAVRDVHKLVEQDKVDIIAGICMSHIGLAVVPTIDKCHVPTLIITAADDLTQRHRSPWLIRLGFCASQAMYPFGEYVYKKLGYRRVITFGTDFAYSWEAIGGFQKSFEQAGGQVIQKVWAPLGFQDFSGSLKKLRKDADSIFICAGGQAAEIVAKQYNEAGLKLPVIGSGTNFDDYELDKIGKYLIGAFTSRCYTGTLDTPENRRFVKAYRAKFSEEPGFMSEAAYTCGKWIQKAVESLKGKWSDKESLMSALRKVELADDPRGPLRLDDFGNPTQNIYVMKIANINGKPSTKVMETIPGVSQFWKWQSEEILKQPPYSRDYPPCTHCSP